MKRLIAAVVLALVAAVANAETPTASSAPVAVVAAERPAAVCPLEMARGGMECLFGWTDAKGQLVCQRWERTRSMVTGLDKFGK